MTSSSRAFLWLCGGLAALGLLVVAITPQLLADLPTLGGVLGPVLAAGVPGLLVVVVVATRRRGRPDQEHGQRHDDASRSLR